MPITIDKPNQYFDTSLWSGTGATQSISSLNFQPDWLWVKSRSTASNHRSQNSVTGVTKGLNPNETVAETTLTDCVTSFNSNGFTLGADSQGYVNTSSRTYVGWSWLANGSGVSNNSGSITSTVSANTTSGFSIVSYTGTGSNATVGHSLGVAPKMIIVKNRSATAHWQVYHTSTGNTASSQLSGSGTPDTASTYWNDTSPTSTLFSIGTGTPTNGSGNSIIAYCFAEVKGFSKFGSFSGNGSADGTFVYTGFKPAFIITKITSETGSWFLHDNKRNGYNGGNNYVYTNASDAELTTQLLDITSNGFKMRFAGGANSSGTSIYMAFAESPFVSSKGIPTTAR